MDNELSNELSKIKNNKISKEIFPEHEFLASCLRIGLTINDLEKLTYVDVMKILITYITTDTNNQKVSRGDIDRLLG